MTNDSLKPVQTLIVGEDLKESRLDYYLSRMLADRFSRTEIKKLIQSGDIRVDEKQVAAHHRVKAGEKIEIFFQEPACSEMRAENIPIHIVAEEEDYVIVNKPAGMVVHPACGNPSHTLVNALLYHIKNLSNDSGGAGQVAVRPGIVHRLDKDTSGIMVVAKNDMAHRYFATRFKSHQIEKKYHAVVRGVVQHDESVCEEPVGRAFLNRKKVVIKPSGGKSAVTYVNVIERFKHAALVEARPRTGRTHQIRVHMSHLGHPILGDSLYGVDSPWIKRQALHAFSLSFLHPVKKQRVTYAAPWPEDFQYLVEQLRKEAAG